VHELAVGGAVLAAGGADAYDPQAPKISFALAAVTVGVGPSMQQGFFSPFVVAVG